ncbi:MAG: signal peptide-domain containing protein [Verrucomicrobiaceae bacterium]|nr:signal peptide-domain containing protein [Verrucomicrobiaceae bacterium]
MTTTMRLHSLLFILLTPVMALYAATPSPFHAAQCEGVYPQHLQGICTNQRDAIYWSFTDNLVKTDLDGRIQKKIKVARHHGDLCFVNGKVYVAVNLGKFDLPAGREDSWVYEYDAQSLKELSRHPVPELVHGSGGITFHDGRFIVVGGLPPGADDNLLYEYDTSFHFVKRHLLGSGYTLMGIQTATWSEGSWWFGCYGKPAVVLRAGADLGFSGQWVFNAACGLEGLSDGRFLVGVDAGQKGEGHTGRVELVEKDEKLGLRLVRP